MIGRVKGCLNKNCSEYHKHYYKASDSYCVKCGEKLSFVCKEKKCFKQLPDDCKDKFCQFHIAERKDKCEINEKNVVKIGGVALGIGTTVVCVVKNIVKK